MTRHVRYEPSTQEAREFGIGNLNNLYEVLCKILQKQTKARDN